MEIEDSKSRLRRLLGEKGLQVLEQACVCVVGIGGVGSNCAEALVRGGVGNLVFIDGDEVRPSNINRQAVAYVSTIGERKVDVMKEMAWDINPDVFIYTIDRFVHRSDVEEVMDTVLEDFMKPDYIVDAIDTVTSKIALAKYAQERLIPVIASAGGANKTDPTRLRFADLFDTDTDPLCRAMRKQARSENVTHLQVLYSPESPVKVEVDKEIPRSERPELGTFSYMPPIMGQMIAGFTIQKLLGGEAAQNWL
ncbi:MAG: ThiF family adenylyltransferase [Eggerthellaceae bacterium]|nr:ThiF family adenylyltransferase [Eggerthellaceae bacterium]